MDVYEKYLMPDEIKSQTMLSAHFSFTDAVIILSYLFLFYYLAPVVHDRLVIFYHLFNVLVPVILTRPSTYNRGKSVLQSVVMYFARDRLVYHMGGDGYEQEEIG